jgi:hypothetical protein
MDNFEYDSIETFEVRAEAFRQMTGVMAPGKDASAAANSPDTYEERVAIYKIWWGQYGNCVRAVMKATEAICQRESAGRDN